MSQISQQKQSIREQMRASRRQVEADLRQRAAVGLKAQLTSLAIYRTAKRVACYLDFDGEAPTKDLVEQIVADKGVCYLPQILKMKPPQMQFLPMYANSILRANKLGILELDTNESATGAAIDNGQIDLVLLPLVAVDREGFRLGMGGGFYDSAFANNANKESQLVGIGFDFQMIDTVPKESWDLPLAGFISEKHNYWFERHSV